MSYPPYSDPHYPGQPYQGQPNPGQPYQGLPGPPPENNLVWAILCTVLCCLPLGVVSIIKATQVNTLWAQGSYTEAYKAAEDAKKFALWGALSQVVIIMAYLFFVFVVFGGSLFFGGY